MTPRQLEVMRLAQRGLLNKEIAWVLGVSRGTVKAEMARVLRETGCSRRYGLLGVGPVHAVPSVPTALIPGARVALPVRDVSAVRS